MADDDKNFVDAEVVEDVPSDNDNLSSAISKKDMLSERDGLVKQYYGENDTFLGKLRKNKGNGDNFDEMIGIIIEEIAKESDNLLGNALYFTKEGNLHDATTISVKRADMFETLTKVLQRKKEMFVGAAKVDYDSPVFKVFQIICFEKLTTVLDAMNIDVEAKQLIISRWVESMGDWQKEIKTRIDNV